MRILISLLALFSTNYAVAQSVNTWEIVAPPKANSIQLPLKESRFFLDVAQLKKALSKAPQRFSEAAGRSQTKILFPLPSGELQTFVVEEASNFHPKLAAQFPAIKSYVGIGQDDLTATIRFDISHKGLHAMIRSGRHSSVFIEPLTKEGLYAVFYKKNEIERTTNFTCTLKKIPERERLQNYASARTGDCRLRTYRLALACTAEYAQFHGGTTADALAAMNTTLTRINGIFENDLSISLQLVENNAQLIFLNEVTDPYSNDDIIKMLDENQQTCDDIIGSANYDVGHVFGTRGGGIAFLSVVCDDQFKASGATGFEQPAGPIFAVDLATHEIGHQFGANHTFNGDQGACAGSNRNNLTAFEPGGGSTIMSYAGICNGHNIQNNSDAYFHAISLQQISDYITGIGNSCSQVSNRNSKPSVQTGDNVFFIPKSTPFVLSGSGRDNESNDLTYVWEQMDNGIAPQPPRSTNNEGPLFRSMPPSTSGLRYFPNLDAIITNNSPEWEVLPSVARELNFRLTVRDNGLGGGCTDEKDVRLTVTNNGPFEVTLPNTALVWNGNSQQTVRWNPAGTAGSPINANNVDILLSTDGGLTYPIALLENTSNDGEQAILIPNISSNRARVMVKASGNVFFDISDQNFTIDPSVGSVDITVQANIRHLKCFGDDDGAISLEVEGGSGSYTFLWENGNRTAAISNLASGTYSVTINDGVIQKDTIFMVENPPVLSANASVFPISCAGESDGTINVVVMGGTFPYQYRWSNGSTSSNIKDLTAGTYTLTVTDNNACEVVLSHAIEQAAPLILGHTSTDASCFGSADGAINLSLSQAAVAFNIQWSNGATAPVLTGLSAGNYNVTVSKGGCVEVAEITINQPAEAIMLGFESVEPTCNNGQNGILTAMANGGQIPYQYAWSTGATTASINGLGAGDYSVTVTDALGCSKENTFQLAEPNAFTIEVLELVDATCINGADGSVRVATFNAEGNVEYLWSNGKTGSNQSNLAVGRYRVTATDNKGCESILEIEISKKVDNQPPTVITQPATIYLDRNGQASLSALQVDNGSLDDCGDVSLLISQTSFDCNSLGSQLITLTASDEAGNQSSESVMVEVRDTLAPEFTCPGLIIKNNCTNIRPLDYPSARDNCGAPTVSLVHEGEEGFVEGENRLTFKATDAAGNYTFCTVTLIRNNTLRATVVSKLPTCYGGADGTATVFPTGGTPPYVFLWNDSSHQTTQMATGLTKGTYFVGIVDAASCSHFAEVTLNEPERISITEREIIEERNDNQGGSIAIDVSGGNPPYRYEWFLGDALISRTKDISGLKSGDYEVFVRDANDCVLSEIFFVDKLIVSTNEQDLSSQILIFPNPVKGQLWLDLTFFKNKEIAIELLDITGRLLSPTIQTDFNNKKYQMDLAGLANGFYFVKIRIGEAVFMKKVILTK